MERFLYTIRDKDKASLGLLATTSYFTGGAHAAAKEKQYVLKLADKDEVLGWIGRYGMEANRGGGNLDSERLIGFA